MIGRPVADDFIEIVTLEEDDLPDGMVMCMESGDGRTARIFLPIEEVVWLTRSRHPASRRHLQPFIERMAGSALQIELIPEGSQGASARLVFSRDMGVTRSPIALSTALLIASHVELPFFVHPQLLTGEILEEVDTDGFRRTLDAYDRLENLA